MIATSSQAAQAPRAMTIAVTVVLPFGIGYFLSYVFRAVNAMIAPNLVAEIGLGAAELGLLTAAYFIAFAAIQVPLGLALDRHGPRRVQAALLLAAALGAVLFAVGDSFAGLTAARALIGLGVAGSLMACFKANAVWWPRERLPLLNGVTTAFGGLGALSATIPVELLMPVLGWRGIFWALAALTVAASALIYFAVPERPDEGGGPRSSLRRQIAELGQVYGSALFWRLAPVAAVNTAAFMAYQTLWAAPWLRDVAGMDDAQVARGLFLFNCGFLAGVLLSGALADALQRVGIRPIWTVCVAIVLTLAVEVGFAAEAVAGAMPLCFAFGFFGSSVILIYAVHGQYFRLELAGRVSTAQNMVSFVVAFFGQWAIGEIVAQWEPLGAGRFDPAGHQAGLLMVIAATVVSFLWLVWPRRTGSPARLPHGT